MIEHVLAVVPVADLPVAEAWYERLFGRAPDNKPMETLAEWRVTSNGWVQVTADEPRAGSTLLNLAVDDLPDHLAQLEQRGLATGPIQVANKGVQLSAIHDPDGNTITFIGGFRVNY